LPSFLADSPLAPVATLDVDGHRLQLSSIGVVAVLTIARFVDFQPSLAETGVVTAGAVECRVVVKVISKLVAL
jgi:hypothetical protein